MDQVPNTRKHVEHHSGKTWKFQKDHDKRVKNKNPKDTHKTINNTWEQSIRTNEKPISAMQKTDESANDTF